MKWQSNKLTDLRERYTGMLDEIYNAEESSHLIDILIEELFNITRVQLALDKEMRISESEMLRLHFAVNELLQCKPVQYITGTSFFLGLKLSVNESVLIPRPETEELVQLIVEHEKDNQPHLIDIGTGSGCIAIAIKKMIPKARIIAVDVSEKALEVADQNRQAHRLDILIEEMNVLDPESYLHFPVFDVVASNPPYVTESDKKLMKDNVLQYEPHTALFSGADELKFYKAILCFCENHLARNGRVYLEINEHKGYEISALLNQKQYQNVKVHQDMHGKDRFVTGTKS